MSALVQEAIGAQALAAIAPEGISPEQVQSAIERAVSEAPQGLNSHRERPSSCGRRGPRPGNRRAGAMAGEGEHLKSQR